MTVQQFNRLADIPGIERFYSVLPVFATQEYANYLKEVNSHSTMWFYGDLNQNSGLLIPFSVRNKYIFKIGQFLTATIRSDENIDFKIEKEFLNSIIEMIKQDKLCDWIEQPPNWALFNVVPSESIYCKFGTYIIDLLINNENELLKKIDHGHRRLINKAVKNNVIIKSGSELLDDCLDIFTTAAARGNHTLPSRKEIKNLLNYLQDKINIYVSYNNSIPHSALIYCSNKFCSYELYIGVISALSGGENHLSHWQAIKDSKQKGIKYFNFVGARINPIAGSKIEGIQKFKKYFGGEFITGYLWKMPINKFKYYLYQLLVSISSLLKGKKDVGDIIDQELKHARR